MEKGLAGLTFHDDTLRGYEIRLQFWTDIINSWMLSVCIYILLQAVYNIAKFSANSYHRFSLKCSIFFYILQLHSNVLHLKLSSMIPLLTNPPQSNKYLALYLLPSDTLPLSDSYFLPYRIVSAFLPSHFSKRVRTGHSLAPIFASTNKNESIIYQR